MALYFTAEITPNPMTFASPPAPVNATSIGMCATTASASTGPIQYYFECTAGGGNNSGWQNSTAYTDSGLNPETQDTYRVRARDKSAAQTATGWSAAFAATTTVSSPRTLYRSAAGLPITWDNSGTVWGIVSGGPYNTAIWSGGDSAVFEETPATVTPNGPITLGALTLSPTSGSYTISGSTLNFTPGATIRNNDNRVDQTITSAITGSPSVHIKDYNPTTYNNTYLGIGFAPAGGTQTLGAVLNPDNTGNKDKAGVTFAGSTYEWDVGSTNATDKIHLVEGRLYLKNFTLKISDAGGSPAPGDHLPVFTYASGVTRDLSGFANAPANFILPSGWSGTPSLVDDGTGTIYLTGIQGSGASPYETWELGATGPNVNAIGLLPALDNSTDPACVIFTFNRNDAAQADAKTFINVEYGNNLDGWTTAVDDNDNVKIQVTDGSPTDSVVVKLKRATLGAAGRIFVRLKIAVSP